MVEGRREGGGGGGIVETESQLWWGEDENGVGANSSSCGHVVYSKQ